MRRAATRTYKIVISLSTSYKGEDLHICQGVYDQVVEEWHTKLLREEFSSVYGCRPSQWETLGKRF